MPSCWICSKAITTTATTIRAAHDERPIHRECANNTRAIQRRTAEAMKSHGRITYRRAGDLD